MAITWDSCDDGSALLAWDFSNGSFLWDTCFEKTLQSLSSDSCCIFAGGVDFVSAVNPHDGSLLWATEIDGMAKALTLISPQRRKNAFPSSSEQSRKVSVDGQYFDLHPSTQAFCFVFSLRLAQGLRVPHDGKLMVIKAELWPLLFADSDVSGCQKAERR